MFLMEIPFFLLIKLSNQNPQRICDFLLLPNFLLTRFFSLDQILKDYWSNL